MGFLIPNGFELVPSLGQVGVKSGLKPGEMHDVVWQSAALVLGLRPWSEAEYKAVFGQLTRSARHFRMGPSSRNYIGYVRKGVGQEA